MNIIGASRTCAGFVLAASLVAVGCATLPEEEDSQLATVQITYPIEVLSVDGRKADRMPIRAWKQRALKLPAGTHNLVVRHGASYDIEADDPRLVAGNTVILQVEVEAGNTYRLVSVRDNDAPEPVIRIQDVTRKRRDR